MYSDRAHAGKQLAQQLSHHADRDDVVVLGLPRGGVPVAAEVASALGAPLDVLVVRKLGVPGRTELAMGAVAGTAGSVELVRNDTVLNQLSLSDGAFDDAYHREVAALTERESAYRQGRAAVSVRDRVVLVVDDGLATGSTMRAAVAAVRRQQPRHLVVAVPVGSAETCESLRREADEVVCAETPEQFSAVAEVYRDFSPVSDDDVCRALSHNAPRSDDEMPLVDDLAELVRLVEERDNLFVRYSKGPARDAEHGVSHDYESGLDMPGLSVTTIAPETWWSRPTEDWVARRLCKYKELGDEEGRFPWLLTGRTVGFGPDHEPLLVDIDPVARVGRQALAQAEQVYVERFSIAEDSRSGSGDE